LNSRSQTASAQTKNFDVAVLGLGAIGSAALYQLAKRGARVLGIDQFSPPHAFGSSHGETRITRCAIGEGEYYTPLALRSQALWREIGQASGKELLSSVGALVISGASKTSFTHVEDFFANTIAAARRYGVAHEVLDAAEIRSRFPQFRIRDDEVGYYEPGAGYLRPEACVTAQLELARARGAVIRTNERVTDFTPRARNVSIISDKGRYAAEKLVVAAGPWLPELFDPALSRHFRVFRQVQFWFAPGNDSFRPDRFPVFIWELSGRRQAIYGFPDIDGSGVKVATEQYDSDTTASAAAREIDPAEAVSMHEQYVAPFLPALTAECTRASSCLYTVTSDFGFVVDRHPGSDRVIIASCCSGHGFKHSAAIGEDLACLALDGRSQLDPGAFSLARLRAA